MKPKRILNLSQIENCRTQFCQYVRGRTPTEALPVGAIHDLCDMAITLLELVETSQSTQSSHVIIKHLGSKTGWAYQNLETGQITLDAPAIARATGKE